LDSIPLPAGTPFGGRKTKLSDPTNFHLSLVAANNLFSLDNQTEEIRDFQVSRDAQFGLNDSRDMQPRISVSAELTPLIINSDPFKLADDSKDCA